MLQALHLTKVFGRRVSVDNLSFTVLPGEVYALLGDNGAGKSTTVNMLATLLEPTSGEFSICGFDGAKQSEHARSCLGVVSQEVALYGDLTAYENLQFIADLYAMPANRAAQRISDVLRKAALEERAHDRVGEFSSGLQRRLSIAIAMLHEPKVILMDEPTVGLDPASRRQIWGTLLNLKRTGVTILLTTHYLDEAEFLADRIGIIRKGRLVMEGTIEQLRWEVLSVSSVSVILGAPMSRSEFNNRIRSFRSVRGSGSAELDQFRNSITFTPPPQMPITDYLEKVLAWLKREDVEFARFATTEPSLEEIFMRTVCTR